MNGPVSGRALAVVALLVQACGAGKVVGAQPYQVGQVVTNFTLFNRYQWTDDTGRIFPEDTPLRLSDLAGHVVFFEFFDPT